MIFKMPIVKKYMFMFTYMTYILTAITSYYINFFLYYFLCGQAVRKLFFFIYWELYWILVRLQVCCTSFKILSGSFQTSGSVRYLFGFL